MKKLTAILAAGAALFLLTSPLRAMGGEEDRALSARGRCTTGSVWALVMEPEVGVKFEANIETGVPDQTWHLRVRYNKHLLIETDVVSEDDGGFEVVKVENNARGMDQATLNATNLDTGERCWGQLKGEL